MAGGRNFPEGHGLSVRAAVALCRAMTAALLATDSMTRLRTTAVSMIILAGLLIITPPALAALTVYQMPDERILITNESRWIILDMIPDQRAGDPVLLSGITNLPNGSPIEGSLLIDRDPRTYCRMRTCQIELYRSMNATTVRSGHDRDVNTFSMLIDTRALHSGYSFNVSLRSDLGMYSDDLSLRIDEKDMTVSGRKHKTTLPAAGAHPVFLSHLTGSFFPVTVRFTDGSDGNPTSWFWNFGDGTTSTQQNPVHTYPHVGKYVVFHTATNWAGTGNLTRVEYIRSSGNSTLSFLR